MQGAPSWARQSLKLFTRFLLLGVLGLAGLHAAWLSQSGLGLGQGLRGLGLPGSEDDEDLQEHLPAVPGKQIGLLTVGDVVFQRLYAVQLQSQRCFARRHGYEHRVLRGNEYRACMQFWDFFFRKHCTIAKFLESKPPGWVAAVLDADTLAVVLDRGLDQWVQHPADVQLYERITLPEIMAGNYMVRNTPFARDFLRRWASYNFVKPPGFSSSDNGAIHLAVMETVQVEGVERCRALYGNLTKSVMELDDYWAFVQCTKDALGPPRHWRMRGGNLTVWPRAHFFAVDGVYLNRWASSEVGPLMHHGIKESSDVLGHYYSNLSACRVNEENVMRSAEHLGMVALYLARGYPQYFQQGYGCRQCAERCAATFTCPPLEDGEEPRPRRTCGPNCTV